MAPKVRRVTWLKVGEVFEVVIDGHWEEGSPQAKLWRDADTGAWMCTVRRKFDAVTGELWFLASRFPNGNTAKAFATTCLLALDVRTVPDVQIAAMPVKDARSTEPKRRAR